MWNDLVTGLGAGLCVSLMAAIWLAAQASQDALVRRLTRPRPPRAPRARQERRQSASASAPVTPEPEWLPISHSDVLRLLSSSVVSDFQESPTTNSTLIEAPPGASVVVSGASKGSANSRAKRQRRSLEASP